MKRVFLFVVFFLIGIIIVVFYSLMKKNPGKPINNILETVAKPTYSIEDAPSQSIRGMITSMSGGVEWQGRTATEAAQINSPVNLQQGEEIQTKEDGNLNAAFSNAANIKIYPSTQIDFVQTLPVNFTLSIASGSAQITKVSEIPISVRAMHLLIKENSGELSVGVDTDNSLVNLNIINGSITVAYNDLNLNSHIVNFNAPQRVSFNDLVRSFE